MFRCGAGPADGFLVDHSPVILMEVTVDFQRESFVSVADVLNGIPSPVHAELAAEITSLAFRFDFRQGFRQLSVALLVLQDLSAKKHQLVGFRDLRCDASNGAAEQITCNERNDDREKRQEMSGAFHVFFHLAVSARRRAPR